ncbi:hypothetical protein LOC51_31200 [Rubrivivax sp. JA1024]|nr:hypothetical protein [Rubrivivax sp. JA1024]
MSRRSREQTEHRTLRLTESQQERTPTQPTQMAPRRDTRFPALASAQPADCPSRPMTLIDKYVPSFSFNERHAVLVDAPADKVLAAILTFRPEDDPLFRVLITLRELPMRARRLFGGSETSPKVFGIDDFTLLDHDDREVVFGLVGQFWRPDFGLARIADGADFAAFQRAGFVKLALNFALAPHSDGHIRLTTETRAFCTDRSARLKLLPYWYAVRPFSGLLRRRILAGLKRRSEAMQA